jgi:hypothetical protein
MPTPREILDALLVKATEPGNTPAVNDNAILARIDYVCRCLGNRAGVRLLMTCMLAKLHRPEVDPRKPYTEIGGVDSFSGRTYDEQWIGGFITDNRLPCNSTTAFLTPALRNRNSSLTADIVLVGRPPQVYSDTLQVLDDVAENRATVEDVLTDAIRILLQVRDERDARMKALVAALQRADEALPLATEGIVTLLEQHLACKHSSRLPVLIVAAAYRAASGRVGEMPCALKGHLSADEQSGAMGDVEICLTNDHRVVTVYEMKAKRVAKGDIDRALQKIEDREPRIDNYIFITTDAVDEQVREYAAGMYDQTNGIEIAIMDCIGFIRHFLHLFHRLRIQVLDTYQALVLAEPESAVNQPLKEAFLTLRQAAQSDE